MGNKVTRKCNSLSSACLMPASYGSLEDRTNGSSSRTLYEDEVQIYFFKKVDDDNEKQRRKRYWRSKWLNYRVKISNFLKEFMVLICALFSCILLFGLIFGLPAVCIVIGVIYKDVCPAEPKIPTFLIMLGAFASFRLFIILSFRIKDLISTIGEIHVYTLVQKFLKRTKKEKKKDAILPRVSEMFDKMNDKNEKEDKDKKSGDPISAFLLMWFFPGNLWIYQIYEPDYVNNIRPDYCHPVLYRFALWLLLSCYGIIGVGVISVALFILGSLFMKYCPCLKKRPGRQIC